YQRLDRFNITNEPATLPLQTLFFFPGYRDRRAPHSFPTRRSSDLRDPDPDHPRERAQPSLRPADRLPPPAHQSRRGLAGLPAALDRKSTRLNSSHVSISYAVFCLKKKNTPLLEPIAFGYLAVASDP